jgi:hypothetical protein
VKHLYALSTGNEQLRVVFDGQNALWRKKWEAFFDANFL